MSRSGFFEPEAVVDALIPEQVFQGPGNKAVIGHEKISPKTSVARNMDEEQNIAFNKKI